jgi:hypothetical protein
MVFLLFLLLALSADALYLVNIPTAETVRKGEADLAFRIYKGGGVVIDTGFGITQNVLVGIPLDLANAISDEEIETSLPLLLSAKVKIVEGTDKIPTVAFGYYDPYGYKKRWSGKRIKGIKGLYIVATKPIVLLDFEHRLCFGIIADVEDYEKGGLSLFFGSEFWLGENIALLIEAEEIFIDKGEEEREAGFNLGMRWRIREVLRFEIALIGLSEKPSRIVKIGYCTTLFE